MSAEIVQDHMETTHINQHP